MTHHLKTELAAARTRVQAELLQAQVELDEARTALAERPAEPERLTAVSQASQKLAEISGKLTHLDGVERHAQRMTDAANRATRVERRKDQRKQIAALAPVMDEAAVALIKHIERLGPLLTACEAVAKDYNALCVGLAREAESDLEYSNQRMREQLDDVTDPKRGYLPSAVVTAFWNAGLGRVGPALAIQGLAPNPANDEFLTDPLGAYLERVKDSRRQVREVLDRTDARLAERDAREA